MRLIDAIAGSQQDSARNTTLVMRLGPCTAFTATTVTVNVDGTLVTAARAINYAPRVGDQVILFLQAGAWVAIGAVPLAGGGVRDVEVHQTLGATAGLVAPAEQTILSVTWDIKAGDVIRAEATALGTTTDINRTVSMFLREDGVTIATRRFTSRGSTGQGAEWTFQAARIRRGLAAGIHTYTMVASVNSNTAQIQADAELSVVLLGGGL